jgi:hypothetical protein
MVFDTAGLGGCGREIVGNIDESPRFVCADLVKENWCAVAQQDMAVFGVWKNRIVEFYSVKF